MGTPSSAVRDADDLRGRSSALAPFKPLTFCSVVRDAGDLTSNKTFDFLFENVEKQHETYNGINARLRSVAVCVHAWSLVNPYIQRSTVCMSLH